MSPTTRRPRTCVVFLDVCRGLTPHLHHRYQVVAAVTVVHPDSVLHMRARHGFRGSETGVDRGMDGAGVCRPLAQRVVAADADQQAVDGHLGREVGPPRGADVDHRLNTIAISDVLQRRLHVVARIMEGEDLFPLRPSRLLRLPPREKVVRRQAFVGTIRPHRHVRGAAVADHRHDVTVVPHSEVVPGEDPMAAGISGRLVNLHVVVIVSQPR